MGIISHRSTHARNHRGSSPSTTMRANETIWSIHHSQFCGTPSYKKHIPKCMMYSVEVKSKHFFALSTISGSRMALRAASKHAQEKTKMYARVGLQLQLSIIERSERSEREQQYHPNRQQVSYRAMDTSRASPTAPVPENMIRRSIAMILLLV